ncbi:beta-propeller domain-containing protein [Vulgatibacter sp.]|uniref:beta-propeller domain-containing protein n=1 Tax=Vulgatibacter sp. TaxID=1971226 RepID=UPI0035618655
MQAFPRIGALALAAVLAVACSDANVRDGIVATPDPEPGATTFVSADDSQGTNASSGGDDLDSGAPSSGDDEGEGGNGGEKTVEEGDVYRTFGAGKLLNLNAYRGLQVVDIANLSAPAIVGRLEMSGSPVELYTSGNLAYVLMNDWRGYWGSREDIAVETFQGGVVLTVDLADPANPTVVDREVVPGWIYKSRLVKGGGQEALYVVSQEYGYTQDASGTSQWTTTTRVKSFGIAAGQMTAASDLDLGGWIRDIAATPNALLVARYDWQNNTDRSLVSLIDISRPDGTMIEGDEIQTEGMVESQFNMDLRGDVLRVVSSRSWGSSSNANHLETFDATDIQNLRRLDHETFGANEDLYATLFMDESAFFVTYFRTDPFHAFSITPQGDATEMSEFIVSGWNDFFRAVHGDTRLVGIGTNDQAGRTMAVSLYDITNLSNPNPLVARAEVAADHSWSEASWDHRAFSVLENAVAVQAGNVVETGLVLLPFSGWNAQTQTHTAGVQIFTFSDSTLTRRGLMNHGSPVHRSFRPAAATAANLSQQELSLFDIADPDQPAELSRVDLAPNYTDVIAFGSHAVRLKAPDDWYRWYYGNNTQPRPAVAQVIERTGHPDSAPTVASFEIPNGAFLQKVGTSLLAAIHTTPVDTSTWPYVWETTVQVYDLSNPVQPAARGSVTTRAIDPTNGYYYGYYGPEMDCFDCGGYYGGWYGDLPVHSVGDALAFVSRLPEEENLGTERVCYTWPTERGTCSGEMTDGCTWFDGYEMCRTRGGQTACTGAFAECTWDADTSSYDCEPIDASQITTQRECRDQTAMRYWSRFEVDVVDLSNPDAPQVVAPITSARNDEAVGVVARGSDLWLSYKRPYNVPGDSRPYVRFFARRIGLANPSRPAVGTGVNVPGQLLEVDGTTLFTRDQVWGSTQIEAAVARLSLNGSTAILEAHRRFPDQVVSSVNLDGAGHVLVSHREGWYASYGYYGRSSQQTQQQLTLLDAASANLAVIARTPVDSWATLKDARAGRALFQVPGGLLVFNLDNPASPWPQAYFATKGWPQEIVVDGRKIVFAAGPYGIYEFDLDESNLQPAP